MLPSLDLLRILETRSQLVIYFACHAWGQNLGMLCDKLPDRVGVSLAQFSKCPGQCLYNHVVAI